jgi:hypothetical protein
MIGESGAGMEIGRRALPLPVTEWQISAVFVVVVRSGVHVSLNAGAELDHVMWFVGEDGEEPFDRKSGLTSHLLPDRRSVCWLYGHARQDQHSRTASPRARTGA